MKWSSYQKQTIDSYKNSHAILYRNLKEIFKFMHLYIHTHTNTHTHTHTHTHTETHRDTNRIDNKTLKISNNKITCFHVLSHISEL